MKHVYSLTSGFLFFSMKFVYYILGWYQLSERSTIFDKAFALDQPHCGWIHDMYKSSWGIQAGNSIFLNN